MEKALKEKLRNGVFEDVSPKRSKMMGAVKGKKNKTTEQRLRYAMVQAGISGWKLHAKEIAGKPDFYFAKFNVAVFVDGCFWHGCQQCGHIPQKNSEFWAAKIRRNQERDTHNNQQLADEGVRVLRFWEHQLADDLEGCIEAITKAITVPHKPR